MLRFLALILWLGLGGAAWADDYVGRQACSACHVAETTQWEKSHHAKSMQLADDATVLGNFNQATITVQGVVSHFFKRDGKFYVNTQAGDGKSRDFPVAFCFGVYPLQQYLIAFADGRLQPLSLAWDARPQAQGGQRWFSLYPDAKFAPADSLHWTGRDRNWNSMCAACHSTDLQKNFDAGKDVYHTTWSDIDVACEACHGPGAAHVAWAKNGDHAAANKGFAISLDNGKGYWGAFQNRGIRTFVGNKRANKAEQICAGCHSRRRALNDVADVRLSYLDNFEPALLDQGVYQADGQILAGDFEYGAFLQSAMHRAGVTCSDCHEPHGLQLRAQGNDLCGQCHNAAVFNTNAHKHHSKDMPGSQCIDCHMPARTDMQVDVTHDHSFRVPRPDLSDALGTGNACNLCHRDRSAAWAAAAIKSWGGVRGGTPQYGQILAQARNGGDGVDAQIAALVADSGQPAIVRATALSLIGSPQGERATIQTALADSAPLVRLGAIRASAGLDLTVREPLVTPLLDDPVKSVRIQAARALADAPPTPELERGLKAWTVAQMVAAERPETYGNLGHLAEAQGKASLAARDFRQALKLDPHFVPGLLDLADLLRAGQRDGAGEPLLREAVRLEPDSAEAQLALGLWLVRQKRYYEAWAPVARAAALDPKDRRCGEVLKLLLRAGVRRGE